MGLNFDKLAPGLAARLRSEWPSVWNAARPWLSLVLVACLFNLPDAVRDAGFKWRNIRASGDLLALLTLAAVSYQMPPWARWVRRALLTYAVLLFFLRIDRMLLGFLMQEEPLLYDQLFLVRHFLVLISDLWSFQTACIVLFGLLGVGLVVWLVRRLLSVASTLLAPEEHARTMRVVFVLWLIALPASATDAFGLTKKPLVNWLSPTLVDNVDVSVRTHRAVKRGLSHSPYGPHVAIELTRKPHVDLFVVESYGRFLWDMASLRQRHFRLLGRSEKRLAEAGWTVLSAFSESTVRGGRSWLADTTVLTGAAVRYEAIYRQMHPRLDTQPSLIRMFEKQGYDTIYVAPGNRVRPGVKAENAYRYKRLIEFDQLGYQGPQVGWGVVPDQYSLGWVDENVVRRSQRPRFMNFHLVTSHSPWIDKAPHVENWRDLNGVEGKRLSDPEKTAKQVLRPLVRYDREQRDIVDRPLKSRYIEGYLETIEYDIELLTDQLVRAPKDDRIVMWFGDHQPPLVATQDTSYDSPVVVMARDPVLLEEFRAQGFTPGLRTAPTAKTRMGHGGLFSLLSRALARCCSATKKLPPFLPFGYELYDVKSRAKASMH